VPRARAAKGRIEDARVETAVMKVRSEASSRER
jgi:hypothetical protein